MWNGNDNVELIAVYLRFFSFKGSLALSFSLSFNIKTASAQLWQNSYGQFVLLRRNWRIEAVSVLAGMRNLSVKGPRSVHQALDL